MCSDTQRELYAQFEPDANEILFGQRTQPDRHLTDQEVCKRKRIILKLVDHKLKFELIELMSRQQQQTNTSNVDASSASSIASFDTTDDWTISNTNYVGSQHFYHPDPQDKEQHFQPQFGSAWHPAIFPQQHDIPADTSWSHEGYNYQPNLQFLEQNQYSEGHSENHKQPHPNLIHLSTEPLPKPKCSPTIRSTSVSVKKVSTSTPKSLHSVNSFPRKSSSTSQSHSIFQSTTPREPLPSDKPLNTPKVRLREEKDAVCQHQEIFPSNSDETKQTTNFAFMEPTPRKTMKRKREHCSSSEQNFTKKFLLFTEPLDMATTNKTSGTEAMIDVKNMLSSVETGSEGKKRNSSNKSTEWSAMDQLVTSLFRNKSNNWKPYSPSDLQLKKEILLQASFCPDALRSNTEFVQKFGWLSVNFITECKSILANLSRADPENHSFFAEARSKLIADVKESNYRHDISQEAVEHRSAYSKISSLIAPFLCSGENHSNLIFDLMKNPHALESNGIIKNRNTGIDVMKGIKAALDSFVPNRLPKKFQVPCNRYVDVPFAVNLYNKTVKMTEAYATELKRVLFQSIDGLKIKPKPSFRDIKFKDGSLEIVCVNNASFEWLEKNISNHLGVSIRPVKNVISKNDLKTICLKFKRPQYLHFNYLMQQLKVDNPRLLTRRWEQRSSHQKTIFDPAKSLYVGVDVESLIILEEMNRVGKLRETTVQFKISYGDKENNFEKMNIVKNKNQPPEMQTSLTKIG